MWANFGPKYAHSLRSCHSFEHCFIYSSLFIHLLLYSFAHLFIFPLHHSVSDFVTSPHKALSSSAIPSLHHSLPLSINASFVASAFQETVALSAEVGDDLEQVEVIQRKFDDFQKDLKANEARLVELNTIAERLTAMGQTEAAEKIRIQIEDLNQRWAGLQQVTQERAQTLGSAHEVQRYHGWVSDQVHGQSVQRVLWVVKYETLWKLR